MTALVTGASGFVGCWLTATLAADGIPVVAQMRGAPSALFCRLGLVDHPQVTPVIDPDVTGAVARAVPNMVYHLAGFSQIGAAMQNPLTVYEANARTTWTLLEALRCHAPAARCVLASTDSLYGETGGQAVTEEAPLRAQGPYETSKHMAELAAVSFARTYGLPVTIARLGNVYGPGDANGARIIPGIAAAVRAGVPPQLRGGGRAVRALLNVMDCIAGLRLLAARAGEPGIAGTAFNLSGDPPMTTLEIAQTALRAFGRPDLHPVITDDAPGETSVKISNADRLRALGWAPQISLSQGLAGVMADWGRDA